jgi:lysophospholipase L1-like esterase
LSKMMIHRRTIAWIVFGLLALPALLLAGVYLSNWNSEHHFAEENRQFIGHPVSVVLLGDSVTAGWSVPQPRHLFLTHPGIVNRGISGDHVGIMILRMPSDVFSLHPRTLVLQGGINDLKSRTIPNFLRFLAPIEIENEFRIVAALTKAHHERLVLCSITPVDEPRARATLGIGPNKIKPEQILAVNAWMKDYAQQHGLSYVDYYSAMTDDNDRMRPDLSDDGLHPNSAGYAVMEPILMQALDSPQPNTTGR